MYYGLYPEINFIFNSKELSNLNILNNLKDEIE